MKLSVIGICVARGVLSAGSPVAGATGCTTSGVNASCSVECTSGTEAGVEASGIGFVRAELVCNATRVAFCEGIGYCEGSGIVPDFGVLEGVQGNCSGTGTSYVSCSA